MFQWAKREIAAGRATTAYRALYEVLRENPDHAKARRAMEARGLAQGYHETLTTGIWPSEDILPPVLRR